MTISSQTSVRRLHIEPWVLIPLLLFVGMIGLHLVLVWRMHQVGADSVERRSWEQSAAFDQLRASRARFRDHGFALQLDDAADADGLRCRIAHADGHTPSVSATLRCYRPDDAGLDRELHWADISQPLDLQLPRNGLWTVSLRFAIGDDELSTQQTHMLP